MIAELRTLIAVARHGTFAAAGDRIGLTQAAVSGHMRRLEAALGFALFDRTGRSATLNAAGLRTLARSEVILASFDALGEPTRDEEWTKPLKIGAINSVQATILARALVPFHKHLPRCRVHLSPGISLHLMDRVDAGELDLAILIRPGFDLPRDFAWTPLASEDYVLIAAEQVGGDDWRSILCGQPFIHYDRSSFGGRQVERFLRRASIAVHEWLEVDDLQAIVALVGQGLGVALVPRAEALLPFPKRIRAISLGSDPIHREIGALHRPVALSSALETFVEFLRSAGAARPHKY